MRYPKKFIESDFVTRARLKYSTTSEDGTVELNKNAKLFCTVTGLVLGTAVAVGVNAVANMIIDKATADNSTED